MSVLVVGGAGYIGSHFAKCLAQRGHVPVVLDNLCSGRADAVKYGPLVVGDAGDVPMLGDFDGDGKVDLAIFRNGNWLVDTKRDGKATITFSFGGVANDRPLAADWSGDKHATPVLFRDGEWLVSPQRDGKVARSFTFGTKGDIPLSITTGK